MIRLTRTPPRPSATPRAAALLALALVLFSGPRSLAAQEGSAGAAIVGGLAGGVGSLWAFHGLSGCPVVTVGAARETDGCDAGSLASALGGLGAGIWVGASDSGAGYGMGVGALAGLTVSFLIDQAFDTPRWLDAALLVTGFVAGGVVGRSGS